MYREHAASVSAWARRLLGPEGDVEDAVHEVFVIAHRRAGEWRGEAQVTTWLYAITVRVVQAARRRQRWRRWVPLSRAGAALAQNATPLQALEQRRAAEVTYRLLEALPEAERSALILFELEGLSGEAIAEITGEPVNRVWVRLHRARARLRKAFQRWERRLPGGSGGSEGGRP